MPNENCSIFLRSEVNQSEQMIIHEIAHLCVKKGSLCRLRDGSLLIGELKHIAKNSSEERGQD